MGDLEGKIQVIGKKMPKRTVTIKNQEILRKFYFRDLGVTPREIPPGSNDNKRSKIGPVC